MRFSPFIRFFRVTSSKRIRLLAVLLILSAMFVELMPAALADSTDTDPYYVGDKTSQLNPDGSKAHPPSKPLSAAEQKIYDKKAALAANYVAVRQGSYDGAKFEQEWVSFLKELGEDPAKHSISIPKTKNGVTPNAASFSKTLGLTQSSQINSFYCGPATAYEMLSFLGNWTSYYGLSLSQSALGSTCSGSGCRSSDGNYLQTDAHGGTDWSNGGGHPMPDGLNYWRQGLTNGFYVPVGTSVNATTFKNNFTSDIDANYPVAGNADEVAGSATYHLVGHPNIDILHWFAIRGYDNNGDMVQYADSISGAPSIRYYQSVPPYSSMATSTIAVILDGRGYVW